MQPEEKRHQEMPARRSLLLKCSAIFVLFLTSALIVACGTNTNASQTGANGPQVTVTIDFNSNKSPIPTAPPYTCSAWVTFSTPAFRPGDKMAVNIKYLHNVNGNPVGVGGASASSIVHWADGTTEQLSTVQTTSDGLAIAYFTIPNNSALLNKNNIVTVALSSPDGLSCTIGEDRAAFFTFVMTSPTAVATTAPTGTPGGTNPGTPKPTMPGIPTITPTLPIEPTPTLPTGEPTFPGGGGVTTPPTKP
jgi:hypothetical protein